MLRHLHVRNLAVIEALDLEFAAGFNVLTGETGAGKSILIDALGLAIGSRAESVLVRPGAERAEVTAEFDLADVPEALAWLRERELLTDDGENVCTIRRVVQNEGRTRAFINGSAVTAGELRALGESLVEIFGQGESRLLLHSEVQRQRLDEYGSHAAELAAVAAAAAAVSETEARIARLRSAASRDPARLDDLRHQLQELEALHLEPQEPVRLAAEHKRLANAGRLLEDGGRVRELLGGGEAGEDSIDARLSQALSLLRGLKSLHDGMGDIEAAVEAAQVQVREADAALRRWLARLELDPQRLAEVERRLAAIHDLARKHRVRADELPDLQARLGGQLAELEGAAENLAALEKERKARLSEYHSAALSLSRARRQAAARLAAAVTERVRALGMPHAHFEVAVEPAARQAPSPVGEDVVRFDFSANPGQPPRPLSKIASGGELSRLSLALNVCLQEAHDARGAAATMIFDEVDAGIGGAQAEIVGRALRALGERRQVLCVTHLAQVAAQGAQHYAIRKETRGGATYTSVERLDAERRVAELARMLGGQQKTGATQALAKDLLRQAQSA